MFESVYNFFVESFTNSDFAKGGIALAISSYFLYKIPATFWSIFNFIKQRTMSTVKFTDYGNDWTEFCEIISPHMSKRHLININGVAPGMYYAWINNRPSIIWCYTETFMDRDRVIIYVESFFTAKLAEFIKGKIKEYQKRYKTISVMTNEVDVSLKAESYSLPTSNCKKLDKIVGNFLNSDIKKLGILLYGTPGNGKTQSILNICKKYQKSIFSMQIHKETTSYSLSKIGWYPDRVTIIEDIDRLSLVHKDNTGDELYKVGKAEILNALDGIASNCGLTIATANDISKIDPAILREGRFDIKIEFTNPSDEDIASIYELEYKQKCPDAFILENSGKTTAEVFNRIKLDKIKKLEEGDVIEEVVDVELSKRGQLIAARSAVLVGGPL